VTLSVSCGRLVFVILECPLLLCARLVTFVLLLFSLQNYLFGLTFEIILLDCTRLFVIVTV